MYDVFIIAWNGQEVQYWDSGHIPGGHGDTGMTEYKAQGVGSVYFLRDL